MKLYRTRTQEEYDWLMQKLEDEGCFWASDRKPTELGYSKQYDVVSVGRFMAKKIWREEFKKGATDQPIIEVSDLMDNKFKVGDEVRVREDLISGVNYGSFPFVNSMKEYRGEVVTIHEVNPRATAYEIVEDGGEAYWTDEMLEPITDHDYLMDKILERNNKPEKLNTGDPWIDNLPESYFEMYEEESLKELTESLDLIEQHKRICERLNKVYADKNHDYGNSFGETYEKYGDISALVRISDKMNRIERLMQTGEQKVKDEALEDSILDMANYLIMWAMELEEEE